MVSLIEEIKSRKLSEVIGKFTHLKNDGSGRKKCCCPFHHEKTPSFHIDDKTGLYHCFGCGAGGDVFTFIENIKQCSFQQAIEYICDIFCIDKSKYKKNTKELIQQENEYKILCNTMETVACYYQKCLHEDKEALNYVKIIRDINNETEREFLFGLANDNLKDLLGYCEKYKVDEKTLIKYGIIRENQNKNGERYKYLFFRNRIMIPIHNAQGKIVAFGGRIYKLNDENAKYLNSSDSEFFKKGNILFNFNRSKKNIGKDKNGNHNPFIIVEGYMDAISLWQAGFKTAIAPLGTSITENHLKIIFNYCQDPIFVFDNDNAGQRATLRACEMIFPILKTGFVPKICTLQGAKDVDEFLKKYKQEDLQKQLNNSEPINQFIINIYKQKYNLSNPNDLSVLQKNIYTLIGTIPDKILKKNYTNFFQNEFNKINFEQKKFKKNNYAQNFNNKHNMTLNQNKIPNTLNVEFIEKKIIAVLLKDKNLQNNCDIDENIIQHLTIKSQELLKKLNNESDKERQKFCDQIFKEFKEINTKKTSDIVLELKNLIIQLELLKVKNSNLTECDKKKEYKKILAKKKELIITD